ncbi:MAG: HAD hydrolase-like protein, partial [Acinetobacter sp.]|nr:HAD hydrolase-like protein [Acinetobacter sp.]
MINSTDIQLVIFDWDGTLCNSINTIVESLHYTAQQYQQPLTDEQAKSVIGLALPSVISTLFPQVPELHQALFDTYVAHNVPHSAHDTWY